MLDDDVWTDVERLLDSGRADLRRMRADPARWSDAAFADHRDDQANWTDVSAPRRARVLWALQYDRSPDDLPLLRFLLEQETAAHRSNPWSGTTQEAALAAFLVCEHRCPDDVWPLWNLKQANFDTSHDIDVEYLLALGARATIALVRASEREDRDDLLGVLTDGAGEPIIPEDKIQSWRERTRARFPADARAESLPACVDRALVVGEDGIARRLMDRWTVGNPDLLATRRWYLEAVFHDFAAAADLQRQIGRGVRDPGDRASAQLTLARLERRAGRPDAAWQVLRHDGPLPRRLPGRRRPGLVRSYVEELFLLVPLLPRGNRARQAFQHADRRVRRPTDLAPVCLDAAMAAAEYVGDDKRLRRYRRARFR